MGETGLPGRAGHMGSTHQTQGKEGKEEEVEGVWEEQQGQGKWKLTCTLADVSTVKLHCQAPDKGHLEKLEVYVVLVAVESLA